MWLERRADLNCRHPENWGPPGSWGASPLKEGLVPISEPVASIPEPHPPILLDFMLPEVQVGRPS